MSLKDRLMPVYRRAPAPVRDLASSVWGRVLRGRRYGPETEELVAEALAREEWDRSRWDELTRARSIALLTSAAERVPYYRRMWEQRRAAGATADPTDLGAWPVLTKAALRQDPQAFVRDDANRRALFKQVTSGTSGTPVATFRSQAGIRAWYALSEARWRRWYGVTLGDRWAMLGGQEVIPVERDAPPYWVWNAAGKQLYLSNLHLKAETAPAYLEAMRRYQVVHAYAYSSSLATLARHALEGGHEAPRLKVAVTNAEPLTPKQREQIEEAFGCQVRESYGMSEQVAAASECEHGIMHVWPDAGVLEVLRDDSDEPAAPGEVGRLVATGLVHDEMPLVRYELGDRGAITWPDEPCACGRDMPRLVAIEGRTTDNLVTADGRSVFWINPVFYGVPVHEAQVVQESVGHVVVNLVPEETFDDDDERQVREGLRRRLGDVEVELRRVPAIPRGPNGKFKAVISKVSASDGAAAAGDAAGYGGQA